MKRCFKLMALLYCIIVTLLSSCTLYFVYNIDILGHSPGTQAKSYMLQTHVGKLHDWFEFFLVYLIHMNKKNDNFYPSRIL